MGSFDSLRHRDFRLFWSGAFLSNVGTWMQATALSWYVFLLTHSAFWVSFVTFVNLFPTVLAPIGGVLTDRLDRRRILTVTQSVMLLLATALAILAATHRAGLATVLVLTLGQGLAFAVNGPTWLAFVPSLVPPEDMVNAIALNSTQFSAARVIGPGLGGALIAASGAGLVFGLNAVSFLAVLGALALIRRPELAGPRRGRSGSPMLASLAGGFVYMWRHPRIRLLLLTTAIVSFFAAPVQALLPVFAADVFHRGASGFGLLVAAVGVGSVAGALALGRLGSRISDGVIAWAVLVVAGLLGLFAAIPWYPAGLGLMALYGGGYLFVIASINSAIQLEVAEHMRGRVISLFMLAWAPFPVGSLVAGAIAQHVGAPTTILAAAVFCAAWGISLAWLARRDQGFVAGVGPEPEPA
jgi:MFS family permease